MIPLSNYLVVGAALFVLGMIGFLTRRNLILMFLCAEMMLQGVTVNLVAFARAHGNLHGQVFTLFIITVAACEAGLALALILMLYRGRHTLDVSVWQAIREPGQEESVDLDAPPELPREEPLPHLTPAGTAPPGGREESYV
jgi:NADH-quinone oxidoreductase subunit K